MTKTALTEDYKDLLYLIRCAVRGEELSESWQFKTPLRRLLYLAEFHSIEALLFNTVKKFPIISGSDKAALKVWQIAHDKAYRRYLMFSAERQAILAEFEKAGIWYLPLKGLLLLDDYPQPYQRQMSDNDIIFDSARRRDVRDIMVSRGYEVSQYNYQFDDVYQKAPFYNFEMHVKAGVKNEYGGYFENLTSRLIVVSQYLRKMTDKDFYIYLLLHELKHYETSGTGVRSLIDLQFYLLKHGNDLDWDDINSDIEALGVMNYEIKRLDLVAKLFSDDINDFMSVLNDDILAYYCSSGTYGTLNQFVDNKLNDDAKHGFIAFYKKKLINSWNFSIANYPILNKYKVLVPCFMVYKVGSSFFNKRNWNELSIVIKKLKKDKNRG